MPRPVEELPQRLMRNRRVTASGCWEWSRGLSANGYGITTTGSRRGGAQRQTVYTHRAAYVLWVGPIPSGLEIDHLCRNRACFNPSHLEAVTRRENTMRGLGPTVFGAGNRSKTHCANGHPYDAANTYHRRGGGRACRACSCARARKQRSTR